jgi:hypothetical protein
MNFPFGAFNRMHGKDAGIVLNRMYNFSTHCGLQMLILYAKVFFESSFLPYFSVKISPMIGVKMIDQVKPNIKCILKDLPRNPTQIELKR